MAYPVLSRQSTALATGYVIFRGALEGATYLVVAVLWLAMVVVARVEVGSTAAAATGLGAILSGSSAPMTAVQEIVFSIGALMFYYVLYRARLVPRWLSAWGLVSGVLYLAVGVIGLFSAHLDLLLMPMALQEMVLAVWLIAKGFSPVGIASEGDRGQVGRLGIA